MYYRSTLSLVILRQFLKELCLFLNLEYRKYTVFRSFLLVHALTHWAEILRMTLFWCTTDQVWVLSLCVNFFEGVMPLFELRIEEIHSFPQFSPTCFDILSWNFAHDFVLMYYRSSLSVVTLRQFLKELCLFLNLEYRKCAVFRTFLLFASRYWTEILHMTLFQCRICFNVLQTKFKCCYSTSAWLSICPSIFCTYLLYALTIELKF